MGKVNNIWSYIARHKYLITMVIGLLMVTVVDENSFRKYILLNMRLSEVQAELDGYKEQFKRDSASLVSLQQNKKGVEKIARERYLMKRDNEDVFVLSSDERINQSPAK